MANTMKRGASYEDEEYLVGYVRGLWRGHHGEIFGTEAEHQLWLGCGEHYPDRAAGYKDGLAMIAPRMLAELP